MGEINVGTRGEAQRAISFETKEVGLIRSGNVTNNPNIALDEREGRP
jgi:hypothetical protein